jgi:crotonobetainyl-CoA:carnitine CoA-transferase CaiB-like acyl-CoA transferase
MTARPQLPDRAPRTRGAPTALGGLLVVDFTRVVAGPACTQTLADFGAEVIKIENPDGGDDTRSYEHADLAGESAAFVGLNRNKRGVALDLTKIAACDVARELIARADVVVENFSSSVMKKYGLDYASVAPTNPDWSIVRSRPMAGRGRLRPVPVSIRSPRPKAVSCRSTGFRRGHRCGPDLPRSTC